MVTCSLDEGWGWGFSGTWMLAVDMHRLHYLPVPASLTDEQEAVLSSTEAIWREQEKKRGKVAGEQQLLFRDFFNFLCCLHQWVDHFRLCPSLSVLTLRRHNNLQLARCHLSNWHRWSSWGWCGEVSRRVKKRYDKTDKQVISSATVASLSLPLSVAFNDSKLLRH